MNLGKKDHYTALAVIAVLVLFLIVAIYTGKEEGNYEIGNKSFCPVELRNASVCIEMYKPVCGWFNKNIQCTRFPCFQTFSNNCFACLDEKVEYWIEGECPA